MFVTVAATSKTFPSPQIEALTNKQRLPIPTPQSPGNL